MQPTQKRSRFQFTLARLLVATAILCVTLGLGRATHDVFIVACFVTVLGVFSAVSDVSHVAALDERKRHARAGLFRLYGVDYLVPPP